MGAAVGMIEGIMGAFVEIGVGDRVVGCNKSIDAEMLGPLGEKKMIDVDVCYEC